jgi:hypothetical protein
MCFDSGKCELYWVEIGRIGWKEFTDHAPTCIRVNYEKKKSQIV